jgi:hypothetical protein
MISAIQLVAFNGSSQCAPHFYHSNLEGRGGENPFTFEAQIHKYLINKMAFLLVMMMPYFLQDAQEEEEDKKRNRKKKSAPVHAQYMVYN